MLTYSETYPQVLKLIDMRKRQAIARLCDINTHNFKIDNMLAEHNRFGLAPGASAEKLSVVEDEIELKILEELRSFVLTIFTYSPKVNQKTYLFYSQMILSFIQKELDTAKNVLKQGEEATAEEFAIYESAKRWRPDTAERMDKPQSRSYDRERNVVNMWEFILQLTTSIIINRGLPDIG